jgi:glycosyltransferase involved in cell wall biosynthesis
MRIVIVSLDSFSLFDTASSFIFGGAELRASIFAKELAEKFPVEVIVVTKDQGVQEFHCGKVKIVPHPERKGEGYWAKRKSLAGKIKFKMETVFSPQNKKDISGFFKSLRPDLLFVLGMNNEAKEVEQFCSESKIPYIFGCASDADLSEKFYKNSAEKDNSGNDCKGYWEVITNAATVLVQSRPQEKMLKKIFNRDGFLLHNPIDLTKQHRRNNAVSSDVLWVGKSSAIKQPELVTALAKQFPSKKFLMILNNTAPEYWNKIKTEAPSNAEIIESIGANEIESFFEQTRILINTSTVEGFPNTFLQAAKYGKPIISLFADPDKMLEKYNSGICCNGSIEMMYAALAKLLDDEKEYAGKSMAAVEYVNAYHDKKKIVDTLFRQMQLIVS